MAKITYEIKKQLAVLSSQSGNGWKKELNLISWNGFEPKYDIRDWDSTHSKMGKGVTLTENELKELYAVLKGMFENDRNGQITSTIQERNVEEEVMHFINKAPLFIQEVKNLIIFMTEKSYSSELKRNILLGQAPAEAELALINEVESLSSIYRGFYDEFRSFLQELNNKELDFLFGTIKGL